MKKQNVKTSRKFKNVAVTTAIAASVMLGSVATPAMAAALEAEEPLVLENNDMSVKATKKQVDEAKSQMEVAENQKKTAEENMLQSEEAYQKFEAATKEAYASAEKAFEEERDDATKKVSLAEDKAKEAQSLLEDAKNKAKEAEAIMKETQEKVVEAEQELKNVEVSVDTTKEDVVSAKNAVDTAQSELDKAKEVLEAKQAEVDIAEVDLEFAQGEVKEYEKRLADAQAAFENAKEQLAEAESKYEAAKTNLQAVIDLKNGTIDIIVTPEYQEMLAMEQELEAAKKAEASAKAAWDNAGDKLETIKTSVASLQSAYDEAMTALEEATISYNCAEAEKESACQEAETAQMNYDDAVKEVENATVVLYEYKQAMAKAEQAAQDAKAANTAADLEVTQAAAVVAEAKEALTAAEERYNEGAKGFYAWLIATENDATGDAARALEVLEDYTGESGVQIGLEGDATSISNILKCLELLKKSNELRATDDNFTDLSDLKVNHYMMAIAQSNADCSHNPSNGHLQHYYVGENLAWGYSNPYEGWYNKEKYIYDNNLPGVTGHYTNIVNPQYYVTGLGLSTTADDRYGSTFSQVYQFGYGAFAANAMTIDEYETLLTNYLATIDKENLQKKLDEANAVFEAASKQAEEKAVELQEADSRLAYILSELEKVQAEKETADKVCADTESVLKDKQEKEKNALALFENAKQIWQEKDAAFKEVSEALIYVQKELETAQVNADEMLVFYDSAKKELEESKDFYEEAKATVDALTSDDEIEDKEKALEEAEAVLKEAKKEWQFKKTAAESAIFDLYVKNEEEAIAKNTLRNAMSAYEEAKNDVTAKETSLKALLEQYTLMESAYEKVLSAKAAVENAKTEAEATVATLASANAAVLLAEASEKEAKTAWEMALDKQDRTIMLDMETALQEGIPYEDLQHLNTYLEAIKAAQEETKKANAEYELAVADYNVKSAAYTAAVEVYTYLLASYDAEESEEGINEDGSEGDVLLDSSELKELLTEAVVFDNQTENMGVEVKENSTYTAEAPDTSDPSAPGYLVMGMAGVAGALVVAKRKRVIK